MHNKCRHIMPSGSRCQSPVLTDKPYCYFHNRTHLYAAGKGYRGNEPIDIPVLEDRKAIQVALAQVLNALTSSTLDPKRAGLLLYGFQIATQNVNSQVITPDRDKPVSSFTHNLDGEELAPEESVCKCPEDCCDCDEKDTCENHYSE